ncbi:Uncharacterised protein [uncultured archaeon]|nr:Uncharacterised protein [uncultured archaeon]
MIKDEIYLLRDSSGKIIQHQTENLKILPTSHGRLIIFHHTRTSPERIIRFINRFKDKLEIGEHVPRALFGKTREGLKPKGMMLKTERRKGSILEEARILLTLNNALKLTRHPNPLQRLQNAVNFMRSQGFVGAELPLAIHLTHNGRNLLVTNYRKGKVNAVHEIPKPLQKTLDKLGIEAHTQLQYIKKWNGKKFIIDVKSWKIKKPKKI